MNFQQASQLQQKRPEAASAVPSASVRFALKEATADAHRRLDALSARFNLSDDAGYRDFLMASAAALLPLEAALERGGVAQLLEDWPSRTRASAICADLQGLEGDIPDARSVTLPASPAALFGVLYVLEGSRLGARFVLKQLEPAGERVRQNVRYLTHGREQDLWRSFAARLESEATIAGDLATTIAAAHTAFGVFLDRFAAGPAS
ncbi:biliverdin-producing heme oxygenase [Radicibacter daui]|uniref:biliverdin-producing heme oxygenase n=1 Tax=Radicibacter daui TaxID=3064829 RepID=UPI004046D6F3